jgi:hypothetical protein
MAASSGRAVGRPKGPARDLRSVRIETRLATMAKALADYSGRPIDWVLSDLVRSPLEQAYADMLKKLVQKGG